MRRLVVWPVYAGAGTARGAGGGVVTSVVVAGEGSSVAAAAELLPTSVESWGRDGCAVASLWHPAIEAPLTKSALEIAKDASILRVSKRGMLASRQTNPWRYDCNEEFLSGAVNHYNDVLITYRDKNGRRSTWPIRSHSTRIRTVGAHPGWKVEWVRRWVVVRGSRCARSGWSR